MAVKRKSRLAEIYRAEKARGGGVASTVGKRTLEKIDPRQFFNQEGFLATILPSMFKAYRARTLNVEPVQRNLSPTPSPSVSIDLSEATAELRVIRTDTKINAKNSMVLPAMARDINLMRQNVAKLVKIQGVKPAYGADMFFKKAEERESIYESRFKKESSSKTSLNVPEKTSTTGNKTNESLLSRLLGGASKGLGIASIGIGIAGFLTAIGGAAYVLNNIGGAKGLKDLMVNLAEGLNAFSGQSLLALGALLGTGMLFGSVTGLSTKAGAALGMTAIGLGIGGFMAGLSAGGSLSDMIGGSAGVKGMLINIAEGLSAFNSTGIQALGALLGAGALFGVVGGMGGAAVAVGANIGIGAMGFAIGAFLTGLSAGGAGVNFFGGASGVKDMLVNLAQGLSSFANVDSAALLKVAGVLPLLGASMLAFFTTQGLGGIISTIGSGIGSLIDFIFGKGTTKSPMEKLASDLLTFKDVDGENLSKIGQGLKDLASGMLGLAKLSKEDMEKAAAAAKLGAAAGQSKVPANQSPSQPPAAAQTQPPSQSPSQPPAPAQAQPPSQSPTQQPGPKTGKAMERLGVPSEAGAGRGFIHPPVPSTSPTKVTPTPSDSILNMIASGEAISSDPYNSMNQGTPGGKISGSGVSNKIIGKNLTDMTVGEILERAPNPNDNAETRKQKGAVFAAGRYQIIPETLTSLVNQGVVSRSDKFTPEIQDKLALNLIDRSGATKSINEGDLEKAQYQLAKVWASLPVPAGMTLKSGQVSTGVESFYGGITDNKAKEGLTLASLQGAGRSSTTGITLAAATTETSTARMQIASAAPVIVNAPTTNNVNQGGGGQRVAQYTAPAVVDSEFMKVLVSRTI